VLVEWTEIAEFELDALVWFIAADSISAALAMDARIRSRARTLADLPEMGRPGRFPGTRELVLPHDRCVLIYKLVDDRVQVLRLIHGGQQGPSAL
jgi:plasmid stabilization system protein ParE